MRLLLASAIVLTSAAVTALALALPASADTRNYDLSGFKRIEASAGFSIQFTQSPEWSVKVDSRYNNLDKIVVEKVGDTLRISRPEGFCATISLSGSPPPGDKCLHHSIDDVITISAPDLGALKLNAGVQFNAPRLDVDGLVIDAHAGVTVRIADLRSGTLNANIGAGSKLEVAGTCKTLVLDAGAGTKVEAKDLKCREADINAGVASKVEAFASERANASAGISTSVLVSGKPHDFTKSTSRFSSTVALAD